MSSNQARAIDALESKWTDAEQRAQECSEEVERLQILLSSSQGALRDVMNEHAEMAADFNSAVDFIRALPCCWGCVDLDGYLCDRCAWLKEHDKAATGGGKE